MKDMSHWHPIYVELFEALPEYGSLEFWRTIEHTNFPCEVIVRVLRLVREKQNKQNDYLCQRLSVLILARLQYCNELWALGVFKNNDSLGREERSNLRRDLCADLNEAILKAIYNVQRTAWENHFVRCLKYERLHVRHSFLVREGHMNVARVTRAQRIPRHLMTSLDSLIKEQDGPYDPLDIEDERSYDPTRIIETNFFVEKVQCLPERLRSVVFLTFWADKTDQEIAKALKIAPRTVNNRLRAALHLLTITIGNDPDFQCTGSLG